MHREPAPAKLNLALHVRGRRADGYHELETLFAFARDGDAVAIDNAGADSFAVTGPVAGSLGEAPDNLVLRARDLFRARFDENTPLAITLDKHLPVASGLGGGSADAAATLRAMARRSGIAPDDSRLVACAEHLGADVPACLFGRTAIGRGKGERLTPADGLAGIPALLVNPGVAVSTAAVFAAWRGGDGGPIPDGPPLASAQAARNDLQQPAIARAPTIAEVIATLDAQAGTVLVRMSGSGATCFALFEDEVARGEAANAITQARPDWWCLETELV